MAGTANTSSAQGSDLGPEVLRYETADGWAKCLWKLPPDLCLHSYMYRIIGGWTCHPNDKLMEGAPEQFHKNTLPVDRR